MTTVAKKLQLGTAAFAVAASAALIAPMVAVADESDSGSDSVGSSASKTPKREKRGASKPAATPSDSTPSAPSTPEDVPSIPTADSSADATGDRPLIQNSLIWFGKPNPDQPTPQTEIYTFTPLADLPGFSQPMFGWMDGFDFEACVLGLSSTTTGMIGPYGTSTTQFSGQGC